MIKEGSLVVIESSEVPRTVFKIGSMLCTPMSFVPDMVSMKEISSNTKIIVGELTWPINDIRLAEPEDLV